MKQLLKFSATWCGPCKMLAGSLSQADLGDVELVDIDIDENTEKAIEYKVRGVPTLILVEDGVEIKRKSGVMMTREIEDFIK